MRNHTATHLMHAALHKVLGEHARQAGSLVAPDRLRFDFNHPDGMTADQIEQVEKIVNDAIAADYTVSARVKSREEAIAEGAMALFGEKYGDVVRTITIMDTQSEPPADGSEQKQQRYSYELCGGIHLSRTSDAGVFIIVSEGSAAAGVRRIEAMTGRGAYELIAKRFKTLKTTATILKSSVDEVTSKVEFLQDELSNAKKQLATARAELALSNFNQQLANIEVVCGVNLLITQVVGVDKETLTKLADAFRVVPNGVCVVASTSANADSVIVMVAVMQDLIKRGVKAGDVVGHISRQLGAGGGGAPHLAFGGGKDLTKLSEALASVKSWLTKALA
jgi:alanyl-tRNA synthetase